MTEDNKDYNERMIIPVDRLLSVYRKNGEWIKDYSLTSFDLTAFRKHFKVPENDPLMYDQYAISEDDLGFISKYLPEWMNLDFQRHDYVVTCYQSEDT